MQVLFLTKFHRGFFQDLIVSMWNANASQNVILRRYLDPVFTQMGVCYTFHLSDWQVYTPGLKNGLTMFLDPKLEEYYFSENTPGSLGVRVSVAFVYTQEQILKQIGMLPRMQRHFTFEHISTNLPRYLRKFVKVDLLFETKFGSFLLVLGARHRVTAGHPEKRTGGDAGQRNAGTVQERTRETASSLRFCQDQRSRKSLYAQKKNNHQVLLPKRTSHNNYFQHDITENWRTKCVANDAETGYKGHGYTYGYCVDACLAAFTGKHCLCEPYYSHCKLFLFYGRAAGHLGAADGLKNQ